MWHRSDTYWLLDRTIKIRSQSDEFSEALEAVLGHATPPYEAARPANSYLISLDDDTLTVFRDCARIVETSSVPKALELFLADLNRHILYSFDGFAAHAGVVRHPSGRVLVFPGSSGAGKSTLTAAAVIAGFEYLSDEALCVPYSENTALPYLKPINLMDWSRSNLRIDDDVAVERPIAPTSLGALHRDPAPVTDIIHIERPGSPGIERIRSNESVGRLIEMSFNHYRNPAKTFETVTTMAGGSKAWQLTYDDPMDAAELLFDRFSEPA